MSAREHWYWDQHALLRSLGTVKHSALFMTHEGFELVRSGLLTKILWLMGPIKRLLFEALQLPLSAYPYAPWRLRLCGTLQKS